MYYMVLRFKEAAMVMELEIAKYQATQGISRVNDN